MRDAHTFAGPVRTRDEPDIATPGDPSLMPAQMVACAGELCAAP